MQKFERPRSFIFVIEANGVAQHWTGSLNRDGHLERSTFRADAYKFATWSAALQCADTHNELRNSSQWKVAPLRSTVGP